MGQHKGYIEMRELLKKVRNANKGIEHTPTKKENISESARNMTIREMKRRMQKAQREISEETNDANKTNDLMGGKQQMLPQDESKEQQKLQNYLQNNNVTIEFEPFEKYQKGVFWGGTIDGQIMFVYRVTPEEASSGIDIEYLEGFDPNDPENNEIIEKLKRYYNDFYQYWRDSQIYSNDEDRL